MTIVWSAATFARVRNHRLSGWVGYVLKKEDKNLAIGYVGPVPGTLYLGRSNGKVALAVRVHASSKSAQEKITGAGGKVEVLS